ncbi:MAG: TIGR04282 family arsenosugar biosynthesis glycosyltransferase [Gammaproteobacteria bacterium]
MTVPSDPARVTLIVFARRPRAGACKRRLARAIGARRAARHYAATLARTLAVAERLPRMRRVLLAVTPADAAWFRRHLRGRRWQVGAQGRGGLGARMAAALAGALAGGGPALLIGSDLVDVEAGDLRAARAALAAGGDVVLGPAADGGYWLIGLAAPRPALFAGIPWGSTAVAACTRARAATLGLGVCEVACRHDLDRGRDLVRRRPAALRGGRRARR